MSELFAGLTEIEANTALCSWFNKRREYNVYGDCIRMTGSSPRSKIKWPLRTDTAFFTLSHEAIHRILDAMNRSERIEYRLNLEAIVFQANQGCIVEMLLATPAQKALAALLALGLGASC